MSTTKKTVKKRPKRSDDAVAYDRVKDIILTHIPNYLPVDSLKRQYRAAMSKGDFGKRWLLLKEVDGPDMVLLEGNVINMSGCIDGLNIFPRSSPILDLLIEMGVISKDEEAAFRREARRLADESTAQSELFLLQEKAKRLGYKVVPKGE